MLPLFRQSKIPGRENLHQPGIKSFNHREPLKLWRMNPNRKHLSHQK